MTDQQILDALCDTTATLSIEADATQHALMQGWIKLLAQWNQTYNLTAHHNSEAIFTDLVADSLHAVQHLYGENIVDVGSGAGVPGIPLAIYCPDKQFTLVDSIDKKAQFMEHCRMALPIPNIAVERQRIEALSPSEPFSTIISRAFGKLSDFVRASYHLGDSDSLWLTFKNEAVADEIKELEMLKELKEWQDVDWNVETYDYQSHCKPHKLRKLVTMTLTTN